MRKILLSLFVTIAAIALTTACGESKLPPSPLLGRGQASGGNVGGNVGQTGTGNGTGQSSGAAAVTSVQGGKLTVSNISVTSSGTSLSATYVHPSYGVSLNISAQSNSNNGDFYKESYNNKGNNWSYSYTEGRCRSYSGNSCDIAYYAIYIVDYDAAGTYMKISNFAVAQALNGVATVNSVNKTDTYLSVDEVEQLFSATP